MPRSAVALLAAALAFFTPLRAQPPAAPAHDPFGVQQLFATRAGGREWFSHWEGRARTFTGLDPADRWFDADHGDGRYTVDGHGRLTATGPTVRMYVHDPAKQTEWAQNLEITVYITRRSETKSLSYSGLQIFARTNHGTTAREDDNLCDCRGYGAKVTVDGRWEFEKEIAHHQPNGAASVATARPWKELPKDTAIGVKYILRNVRQNTAVKVELYRDLTGGANGGHWEKLTEYTDSGENWGLGRTPCVPGVKPELPLLRAAVLSGSESKQPMMSVYLRHEYGTMDDEKFSIREIDPLP